MKMARAGALTALLCLAIQANAQEPTHANARNSSLDAADSAFVATFRSASNAVAAAGGFSGAVLVVRDGRTLFESAYSMADRERGIANTVNTQFRVGSMNKMLTAVATLQLVQAGKLRLDAPFGTYLTNYPNADMAAKVTIHHLLTHTGGTGDIFGPEFTANRLNLRTPSDYLRLFGTRPVQFEPGTRHVYSNYGFILLGAIIERVSGMSYDEYIAKRVLAPAGMTATGSAPEDSIVPGRSLGYMKQNGALVSNAPTLPYRGSPAGGWYSTVRDLARFAAAVQENKLLDSVHTALLYTGKVQVNPDFQYAYGFMDRVAAGRRWVGHGGAAPGMSGELSFEPNGGYVVAILANFDPPAATLTLNFIHAKLPPAAAGSAR